MRKKKKKSSLTVPVLLVTFAVLSFGISLYLWYHALVPATDRISIRIPSRVSPSAFSAGLSGNLQMALTPLGIGPEDIATEEAADREDTVQRIITVSVPRNIPLTMANLKVTEMAGEMGGEVIDGVEDGDGRSVTLTLGVRGRPTDIVILSRSRQVVEKRVQIAVVIDDLGRKQLSYARRLIALDQTVTLAILPFQRRTDDVLRLARKTGTPYILHMPMEPKSENVNPGEGALLITDNEDTVYRKLDRAFASVDDAPGLNNHMGSKVTEDARIMEYVTRWLSRNNLFFLDSLTSRSSKGYDISQRNGVKSGRINGYLDAVSTPEHIETRLNALTDQAFQQGRAIILGHDRPETIEILERELPKIAARGADFVPLSEVLR